MKYKALQTEYGVPTVIIQNSHNRSSGLKFHTGFIRFACANGLILGEGIEEQRIRHSSTWKDKATSFLNNYTLEVERMEEEHQAMKAKRLSRYDMMLLAEKAVGIRYNLEDVLDPLELNLVRRTEDRGSDLYTTYNRLQESLLQGMFQRRVANYDKETNKLEYSPWGKAAKLTATDEIIRVNKELRQLVMEVA